MANTGAPVLPLEVVADPLFEIFCLANVEQLVIRIEIALDTRQRRQSGHLRQQLRGVCRRRLRVGVGIYWPGIFRVGNVVWHGG